MLKVVGASPEQTRLCSGVLGLLLLVCFGVMLFSGRIGDLHAASHPGVYSATVYWTSTGNYRIEFWGAAMPPLGVARAIYTHGIPSAGWSHLELETSPLYADTVQAYAAGFLEGSLTWQLVHWRWTNTVEARCAHAQTECERVRARLRSQADEMRARAYRLSDFYPFWHQVRLFFEQLDGLEAGWWYAVRRNKRNLEISSEDFLWMNVGDDFLTDRDPHVHSFSFVNLKNHTVHIAHSTANTYGDMLRIVKKYSFNYHETNAVGANSIAGNNIVFSGYPGSLTSQDNLYMSGALVVAGGGRQTATPRAPVADLLAESILALSATRLATDGRSWAGNFVSKWTPNGQPPVWAIIDITKLSTNTIQFPTTHQSTTHLPSTKINIKPTSKFISALHPVTQNLNHDETKTSTHDKTETFHHTKAENFHEDKEHLESFNQVQQQDEHQNKRELHLESKIIAANTQEKFISAESGLLWIVEGLKSSDLSSKLLQEGFWASHANEEIDRLYAADEDNFNTSEDVMKSLRKVARKDPCARGDLCPSGTTPYGYIDTKVVTGDQAEDGSSTLKLEAISGPIYEETDSSDMFPFSWSDSVFSEVPHVGQPEFWDFQIWTPLWAWN